MSRHEKAKVKAKGKKHRSRRSYISEENDVPTSEEVAGRTLNTLHILGNQRFALPPFYEHFGRWLDNLGYVLSKFESSPAIRVDDQFVKECSQILSNIELQLEKRRCKEVSNDESIRSLLDKRIFLERIEKEYTIKTKEIKGCKDREINRLSRIFEGLREELDRINRIKTGIFRVISKKTKAKKEAEATQRLNSAQKDLKEAVQYFTAEEDRLRDEYEKRKHLVIEQIRDLQKKTENQEFDHSIEDRQAACESLANVVSALLHRKNQEIAKKDKR
jgi:hypothetical protein